LKELNLGCCGVVKLMAESGVWGEESVDPKECLSLVKLGVATQHWAVFKLKE
jgi:hypothetical protein